MTVNSVDDISKRSYLNEREENDETQIKRNALTNHDNLNPNQNKQSNSENIHETKVNPIETKVQVPEFAIVSNISQACLYAHVEIHGVKCQALIDTGSSVTLISKNFVS